MTKNAWPKVTGRVTLKFEAIHAMPRIGKDAQFPHYHKYEVVFGWTHEIQPMDGYTHEVNEQRTRFKTLLSSIHKAYLNDELPMQPSAEVIALWLLAHTEPAYCDHIIVRCYEGYEVRVDRSLQRSEWMQFLAGRGADPYSNDEFKLK